MIRAHNDPTAEVAQRLLWSARALPLRRARTPLIAAVEDIARHMHLQRLFRGRLMPSPGRLALILDLPIETTVMALLELERTGFVVSHVHEWFARGTLPAMRFGDGRAAFLSAADTFTWRKALLTRNLLPVLQRSAFNADAVARLRESMTLPVADCVGTSRRRDIDADLRFDLALIALAEASPLEAELTELLKVHFRQPAVQIIRRWALTDPAWRACLRSHRDTVAAAVLCRDPVLAINAASAYASAFDVFFEPIGEAAEN